MKNTTLIVASLLLFCLALSACSQPITDAPSTTAPSVALQGGLEDSIFDDVSATDATQPSTGAPDETTSPETQPDSSVPETQPSGSTTETKPSGSATETKPNDSTTETKPNGSTTETQPGNSSEGSATLLTYEQFQAMTGAEQFAYQSSFADLDAFFAWYNAAKETYEKENPSIEIGSDGVVDMEDLLGKQD